MPRGLVAMKRLSLVWLHSARMQNAPIPVLKAVISLPAGNVPPRACSARASLQEAKEKQDEGGEGKPQDYSIKCGNGWEWGN